VRSSCVALRRFKARLPGRTISGSHTSWFRKLKRGNSQGVQWLRATGKNGLLPAEDHMRVLYLIDGDERTGTARLSRAVARGEALVRPGAIWPASTRRRRAIPGSTGDFGTRWSPG